MAGRIKDSDKEELKSRINIADVIGEYVKLKPAGGGSFKGLCPFHGEKSASFQVTPSKQMFYCFGCQTGGDVFRFLELHEKMAFPEAVDMLAARIGYQLSFDEGSSRENGERARVLEANSLTAEFFRAALASPEAEPGRKLMGSLRTHPPPTID
jgi:DNA primase